MKPAQQRRIDAAFTDHPTRGDFDTQCCELIRRTLKEAAVMMADICPDGRELNSALKFLEQAQDFAIHAITRIYPPK